ncbi:MAG: dipicolinate synthase subunit A [Ruminococcus sp.]|nr:dipicolinate synthase subunit A [Ruminococcus sp.]
MDKLKILTAGGDLRQIYCADKLAEKYKSDLVGFDSDFLPYKHLFGSPGEELREIYDALVLPVMPLNSDGNINTPCSRNPLKIEDIIPLLKKDALIFTGRTDSRLDDYFPGNDKIDYMSREELALNNAIPTAEGAVKLAMENLPVTLNGLPVLIVGLGRIGTALAEILKGFGADVTAAVRNAAGAAKSRILGIKSICTKDMDGSFGLVFNTVPSQIFDGARLEMFPWETLFIDLASRPGGFDMNAASIQGKKVLWALGIPGKSAPVTAGKYVGETVINILEERGACHA